MPLIAANGTELFYEMTGPADAPVVVWSNSIGTTMGMWEAQVPALSGAYRVLRYDARGHGRSPVLDKPATIETLADDLVGLLDALEIGRAHVAGLSLGGMTAQAAAIHHPARVVSLVLMATSAYLQSGWTERAALVREKGMAAIGDATMLRWFTPAFLAASPGAVAPLKKAFLGIDPVGYAVCCGAIGGMDLRPHLSGITAPTLIIAGADDPATPPAMSEDMRSRIASAEMIVLPRAAHQLSIERPDRVNQHLLGFFASLPGE